MQSIMMSQQLGPTENIYSLSVRAPPLLIPCLLSHPRCCCFLLPHLQVPPLLPGC